MLDLTGIEFSAELEYRSDAVEPNNWVKAEVGKDGILYDCWWYTEEPDTDLDEQNIDWSMPDEYYPIALDIDGNAPDFLQLKAAGFSEDEIENLQIVALMPLSEAKDYLAFLHNCDFYKHCTSISALYEEYKDEFVVFNAYGIDYFMHIGRLSDMESDFE